jgi:hypothetical protein
MGKPPMVGTVWVARATLYDKRMRPVASCMDTPNAIAKAFMEVPHAVAVKEYLEHTYKSRAEYLGRMNQYNMAQSHVSVFRHPTVKARKPRLTR